MLQIKPFRFSIMYVADLAFIQTCWKSNLWTQHSQLSLKIYGNQFIHVNLFRVVTWNELQDLGSCDRASWAKSEEREKPNKMQQLYVYY